ncbi:hypothetical protein JI749_01445 [Devosia oryziradicis]|uniref:Uncharacterized protein n=1 Tax=Devosia oryziradicis TaxID=2801335 RepID=A0ABX7BWK7_9HYPH|nr:hypothetical protein [Devosia oryziradicis]QQR36331.1 hypothetical protein JI749_01445 [Devosia oryziradicis]
MKMLLAALAITLTTGSALAFDAETQSVIDRHKANKPVSMTDVATLMQSSEQWCYNNQDHSCAWTDIYLEVTNLGATFEIGNAWDADTDIAFTDKGIFRDDRYICETGADWVPTVRATRRSDGSVITGRQLWEIKQAVYATRADDTQDCFDYLYLRSNADQQTITLLQRQYTDDVHVEGNDVEVSLHFNAEDAAGLTWRW